MIITNEIARRVADELNRQPWTAQCWFDSDGHLILIDHGRWTWPPDARWGFFGSDALPLTADQVRERLERREEGRLT